MELLPNNKRGRASIFGTVFLTTLGRILAILKGQPVQCQLNRVGLAQSALAQVSEQAAAIRLSSVKLREQTLRLGN
jgi:hypothetical protein